MLNLTDHKDYICPQCKQPTDCDARFCKNCAFDLNQPADSPDALADIKHNKILNAVRARGALILGILVLAVFPAGCGQSGSDNPVQTSSNSSLSTPSVPTADSLTEAEMMDLMKSRGIWGPIAGLRKHDTYEILRVGPYNKDGKFYPVQVKVSDLMSDNKIHAAVWDCRFLKNDYGDWEIKKMGL